MIELLYEVLYLGPVGLFTLGIFDFPYSIRIAVYAVVLCQFLMKKRYVKLVLAIGFAAHMVASVAIGFEAGKLAIAACLVYVFLLVTEYINRLWQRVGGENQKKSIVFLAPFILGVVILVGFLPTPSEPYDWKFFIDTYNKARSAVITFVECGPWGSGADGEALIGFSEDAVLKSGLEGEGRKVMTITVENSSVNQVYLAGKIYDSFDGKEWDCTYESKEKDSLIDSLYTISAIEGYCDSHTEDYYKKVQLDIQYDMMRTPVVFSPTKSFWDSVSLAAAGAKSENGVERFSRKKGAGTNYRIKYLMLNQDRDFFEQFMSESSHNNEEWSMTVQKNHFSKIDGLSEEDEHRYEERVECYAENVEISPEVKKYLEDVTAGAHSDYERLLLLEAAFNEMEYTLKPGPIDQTVDSESEFLDYFLLKNPKGYCSYYATSFVLLSRAMGYPARFVQGYRVPVLGGNNGVAVVTSDMAHAWPEVYFEGVGWIAFEPTPGFNEEQKWHTYDELKVDVANNPADAVKDYSRKPSAASVSSLDSEVEKKTFLQSIDISFSAVIKWGVAVVAAGALLVVLMFIIDKVQYLKLSEIEKKKIDYRKKLGKMKKYKAAYEEGETLEEYKSRVKEIVPKQALDFIDDYEKLLYGPNGSK